MKTKTYKIVRFYANANLNKSIIDTGLTWAAARKHCGDPEASSTTCTNEEGRKRTELKGAWFDGYYEE